MSNRTYSAVYLVWSVVALAASGCGSESNTASVSGSVTVSGQPLGGGAIQFFPSQGRPTIATIDESGKYLLELPHGEYQVTINERAKLPEGWKEGDPVPFQKALVPAPYTSRVNTPLKMSVTESGAEPSDFSLP
jgi:hypothetical protein